MWRNAHTISQEKCRSAGLPVQAWNVRHYISSLSTKKYVDCGNFISQRLIPSMSFIIILHARLTRPGCLCEIAWQRAPPYGMSLPLPQINLVWIGFVPFFRLWCASYMSLCRKLFWCVAWDVRFRLFSGALSANTVEEQTDTLPKVKIHFNCNAILRLSVHDARRLSCTTMLSVLSFKPSETWDICCSSSLSLRWNYAIMSDVNLFIKDHLFIQRSSDMWCSQVCVKALQMQS